jgi:flavin-dependent dehydrogenase
VDPRILIVGGGPAGAACGIELASRGIPTVVLEKGQPLRDKVCGDGLNVDTQKALARLGLFDRVKRAARAIPRAVITGYRGERIAIDQTFYTMQRSRLDQILREAVEENGGVVVHGAQIDDIQVADHGVTLADRTGVVYSGDVVVLATGVDTRLAKALGFGFPPRTAAALRGYVPDTRGDDAYRFYLIRDIFPGYAWAFPCPDQVLNVGVITFEKHRPKRNIRELLRVFVDRTVGGLTDRPGFVRPPRGFQLRTGLRRGPSVADRVLLVGENVDCTYDLSGEGIGKALESGILAAEAIAGAGPPYSAQQLRSYERNLLASASKFHDGYARAMRVMADPIGNLIFTKLLAHSRKASRTLAAVIREERFPQELFTPGGLVKTLLSRS